jgi:uncharacterized protein YbjT (DUF2867 family)
MENLSSKISRDAARVAARPGDRRRDMSTTERRTILVTGATGAQGGSVVRHLLERGSYAVRALTRNPDSEGARALAKQGVEVVAGDLDHADSLRAALDGCYGAFGVTNFWEHFDGEAQQGRNLVDAVADAGIRHFVFSTLPNVKQLTDGEIEVPHFDIKGEMEDLCEGARRPGDVRASGVLLRELLCLLQAAASG